MTTQQRDILVVDDEPDLRLMLRDYFTLQGYAVRDVPDAASMRRAMAEARPAVILLDINMPGETGIEALERLRAEGDPAPVLLLTAREGLPDRVTGLARGADDYVVKPFEPRELLARVRAVLRRVPPVAPRLAPPPGLRLGRCFFDAEGRRLIGPEQEMIDLTAMELDLLEVFLRHPRQTMNRDRLSELAHGRPLGPGDRSIDLRILRLRKKIELDPSDPRVLRTVHGEGYRYDPDS